VSPNLLRRGEAKVQATLDKVQVSFDPTLHTLLGLGGNMAISSIGLSLVLMLSGLAQIANAEAAKYQKGSYDIDSAHSKVGFEVAHLVISTVEGRFTKFDGKLELAEPFEKSKVNMTVDINSISTGQEKRDDHLRSPDFFDAKKFGTMTFVSKEIKGTPDSFQLIGTLTIKGKPKQIPFEAKYLGTVNDAFGNQKAAFIAKAKINRKEFGLNWNNVVEAGPVVGDEVTIELRLQAGRPLPKAKPL